MTSLLISKTFPPRIGGSGRWFWELYRRLPPDDYVLAVGQDPRQRAFDRAHHLPIIRVPLSVCQTGICSVPGFIGYWRALRAIRGVVWRQRIEQIHCGTCLPEGWVALLLKKRYGLPYLCYVHGDEVKLATSGEGAGMMSSRELRWMTGLVLRGADLLIANSRSTARILQQEWGLPAERVRLLYPGVDTGYFVPAPGCGQVRQRLGWGGRRVILTVGRLQQRKGHDQMILALQRIREAIPEVLYAIVGQGEERPRLENLVAAEGLHDHVRFLGELDDPTVLRCYQQCDLFVLPNRQIGRDIEGFGIVLLEAQACGKPVVAGASGGTAETMRIPETGRVVPCDHPDELATLVAELLADRARLARMGEAARRWTAERFDWGTLSREALQLFLAAPWAGRQASC